VGTFLVDGSVAGTWRHERGRVETTPFGRLHRSALRELREEGNRLAQLYE
jgi:Winged helix DNA-binding domain